jgi:integrase
MGITYRRFHHRDESGRRVDTYVRLPDPTDPRFAEALARVNAQPVVKGAPLPGSVSALCVDFRAALARKKLAAATRRNYQRYVDMIDEEHGKQMVAALRPANVYKLRDRLADTPGKANNWLNVLKQLMAFAAERDWRPDNPAAAVPYLELGEHEPSPAEVIEAALEAATPMLRLAIITGLCLGQRVSDVIRMQHGWIKGGIMELTQQKTKRFVAIPLHPMWLEEVGKIERKSVTLLYDRMGKPFTGTDRIQERLRRLMDEVGYGGYTFHGLRKNAWCYLLELGLSDREVGSVLGMEPETVSHYGKRAQTLMIARGAADRITGGKLFPSRGEISQFAQKKPC